jgi:hypothetical protein
LITLSLFHGFCSVGFEATINLIVFIPSSAPWSPRRQVFLGA